MLQIRIIAVAAVVGLSCHGRGLAQQPQQETPRAGRQLDQDHNSVWRLPVSHERTSVGPEELKVEETPEALGTSEDFSYGSRPAAGSTRMARRPGDQDIDVFDLNAHDVTFRSQPKSPSPHRFVLNPVDYEPQRLGASFNDADEPEQAWPQNVGSRSCGGCDGLGCSGCTDCPLFWEHRSSVYGEFLFLTARDTNITYASPVDGLGVNAVPIGRVAVADPDYETGFRVGGAWMLDSCTSLTASFTHYESSNSDRRSLPGGSGLLRANLVHPNTANVASDSLSASINYDIDFDLADVNYKGIVWGGCDYSLNYLLGFRYGRLDQDLGANYLISGRTTVDSEIDFDGFGPRIGLEGERLIGRGLFVYGEGFANFLAGDFDAEYRQNNIFSGTQAETGIEDDRIVSLLELEIGLGWQSQCGRVRATAGYYVGSWFNTLTMPAFIEGVQADDLDDIDETLTFDGLTTRVEFRY